RLIRPRTRHRSSPRRRSRTPPSPIRSPPLARTRPLRPRLREFDRPLAGVVATLAACGVVTLYSAGQTDVPTFVTTIWQRQLLCLGVRALAAFLVFGLPSRLLE